MVTFYKINENGIPTYPVLYLDTLKVSTLEQTAETTEARGGKGNAPLISWDYNKEINVTLEDALFSAKSLAIMFGNGTVKSYSGDAAYIMKTEQFVATSAGGAPVQGTSSCGWNYQFEGPDGKLYTKINPKFYSAAGDIVTTLEANVKYFCTFDILVNGSVIDVGSNTFPGTYYITGDTFARSDASGDDEFFQFIIPKAKVQSENTITLEAEGDPSVFNMNLKVLRPADGVMMKLVQYNGVNGTDPAAESSTATIIHNHNLAPASQEVSVAAGASTSVIIANADDATSSNTSYATIGSVNSSTGAVTITGVTAGSCQVTVVDADDNPIADINVTVTGA